MIRALRKADIDSVAEIWLDTNRKAHAFIPASYWERNFASVKEMLPQAEVRKFMCMKPRPGYRAFWA